MKELRDIPGFEGKYAVTEDGQVWSYQSKKFMKIANGNNGYKQVCLTLDKNRSKNFYIHRLVALAYLRMDCLYMLNVCIRSFLEVLSHRIYRASGFCL